MDGYERLANAFVEMAGSLTADYDVVELAQQLIENSMVLLPIAAAGIVLVDPGGELHVLASSSEQSRLLELFQIQAGSGPCLEAFRTGRAVFVENLSAGEQRWPKFAERAAEYGLRAVSALPLRLREQRVGALNLFHAQPGSLSDSDIAIGQALADVAAIGVLHQRIRNHTEGLNQQLQTALNTRVVIEQAKGVLAERGAIDVDRAFTLLRAHARRTNQRLVDVARDVVGGGDTDDILRRDS